VKRKAPRAPLPVGTVTFLFTDIEGSTRRWEADPATMRKVLERHDAILTAGIEAAGGRALLDRGEGDSFFAVFSRPSDAIAAALAIQRTLLGEPWPDGAPVRVRMSIHTGQAGADYRGPDTNRAARIRAIGHGGQVLVSRTAEELARGSLPEGAALLDVGEHRLKDVTQPERVFQLVHPDLPAEFPRLKSLNAFRVNLPAPLTTFVGRDAELSEVKRLVRGSRLVTLTGAGGTGKTRLAQETARAMIDDCPGGVFFADLAPLADGEWVAQTVAAAMDVQDEPGLPPIRAIAQQLGGDRALLVLDNCEHVVEASSRVVDELLAMCPQVSAICTSREALNIPGEVAWRVPPMGLPPAGAELDPARLAGFEAVGLFVQRAAAGRPGFALDAGNAEAVAEICRRLDGIPLAIELAAARVRAMSPGEIRQRLGDRFRLLTGGGRTAMARQQTLAATVEWSHALLSDEERTLFRRLSVFAGGLQLDAAEAVCGFAPLAEGDVVDHLARLVDKSLLTTEDERGATRYRMLETLREYARDRLAESPEAAEVGRRHFDHYAALGEAAYAGRTTEHAEWLTRLELERDNLRVALDWAAREDPGGELRLAGAQAWFWGVRGPYAEGRERLAHALGAGGPTTRERARALRGAGELALTQGAPADARRLLEAAIEEWRAIGDSAEVAQTLERLGLLAWMLGDADAVTARFGELLPIWRELGNERRVCYSLMMLGQAACMRHDYAAGEALYRECEALARRLDDPRSLMYANHGLADLALVKGDAAAAQAGYRRGLTAARDFGDKMWMTFEMEGEAMAAARLGDARRAARLAEAARGQRQKIGLGLASGWWVDLLAEAVAGARERLGEEAADAAMAEGREMSFEAIVEAALDEAAAG